MSEVHQRKNVVATPVAGAQGGEHTERALRPGDADYIPKDKQMSKKPKGQSNLDYAAKKLFTKEDPHYFHKTLGLLAVCQFIYRYFVMYFMKGSLNFSGRPFDWACMLVHVLLSCSSLIFIVLPKRISHKPAIIWEEYRLHAIVFTIRCFSVYCYGYINPLAGSPYVKYEALVKFVIVMGHHYVADKITDKYGNKGETTVRGQEGKQLKPKIVWLTRFYALYQLTAVGSHIMPSSERTMDLAFNTLIAIQSSAFLMTLFRKGVIRWYTHAIVYTTCLIISFWHILVIFHTLPFIVKCAISVTLRVNFRVNKYLVHFVFAALTCYETDILDTLGLAWTA